MNKDQSKGTNQIYVQLFSGFQNPKRIRILFALREKPGIVSDIAKRTNLSQSMVSRHLKILRESGLVNSSRKGNSIFNVLANHQVVDILDSSRTIVLDKLAFQSELFQHLSEHPHTPG
ncbi:MAG: metalloregulator ArsR/SmtB family transcription factor [Chloroflexota bacterium]